MILLKEIVVRELYTPLEIRSIGDVDILVKKEDIQAFMKSFISKGYECDVHILYI